MINLYEDITKEILGIVEIEDINESYLEVKLDKRQAIIDNLNKEELKRFTFEYKDKEIYIIDEKIKSILENKIARVKKELTQYKTKKAVNTVYANMNKNNLSIFSKKV